MKKLIKYGSRVVLGLITAFFGLATNFELTPVGDGPCEAGQGTGSIIRISLCTGIITVILYCLV